MYNTTSFRAPLRTIVGVLLVSGAITTLAACGADADATTDSGDASVAFAGVNDDDRFAGPVNVSMLADGVTVEPAGEVRSGAGHFHIITEGGCVAPGEAIPKDATHVHFGDGSAEAELALAPGSYELCLQLGNGEHIATSLTDTVDIDVGVETLDEACRVGDLVDGMTEAVDGDSVEFAAKQAAYVKAALYAEQIIDGLEVIEPSHRAAYEALLGLFIRSADVIAAAPDFATAEAGVQAILDAEPQSTWDATEFFMADCDSNLG